MDESYEKKHYNSGWRPLCKENFTGSNILVETFNKLPSEAMENHENVETPNPFLLNNQEELVQTLAAIRNEITALDKKFLDQGNKLDRLLSALDDVERVPLEKHSDDVTPGPRFWGLFGRQRQ